jgi:hypothetical protein
MATIREVTLDLLRELGVTTMFATRAQPSCRS